MKSAVFASALVVAGAVKINLAYNDCGSSSTHAKINALKPDSIEVPGKATIVGSGILDSDQTAAHFSLKVKKGFIPFVSGKGNICEDTTINLPLGIGSFTVKGLDCPIKAGNVDVEVDLDLLSDLFEDGENSLLSIHIDANADDTGDQLICLDVDASLGEDANLGLDLPSIGTAVTYEDCGAKHARVTDFIHNTIHIGPLGENSTYSGTGTSDEDVTSARFTATVSVLGVELSECSGDGTKDIVCNLPMGNGKITVQALSFPIAKGTISIPVKVEIRPLFEVAWASLDVHVAAEEQNGESLICLDLHVPLHDESVMV